MWICMQSDLLQPPLYRLKRLLLRDVVNEERSNSFSVMRWCNASVFLLPRSVPDLSLYRSTVSQRDSLCCELNADCWDNRVRKLTFHVSVDDVSLPNTRVANKYYLVHMCVCFPFVVRSLHRWVRQRHLLGGCLQHFLTSREKRSSCLTLSLSYTSSHRLLRLWSFLRLQVVIRHHSESFSSYYLVLLLHNMLLTKRYTINQ